MSCTRKVPNSVSLLAASLFLTLASASQAAGRPDCITGLTLFGIKAERTAVVAAPPFAACIISDPVVLISVASKSGSPILFPDRPLLSCAMAERLARFSVDTASPMAVSAFGKALAALSTGPGYECRTRNRQAGAKVSSHGQGNAVDVMTLEMTGGRRISAEKPEDAAAVKFFAAFRAAACVSFNTVLGPGADPSHASHIHLDIEPRGKNGAAKFCQ